MKRIHIKSGQHYAEQNELSCINEILRKYRKEGLKPEKIKYTMLLIIVEPEMAFKDLANNELLSKLSQHAEVDFTQKRSPFLKIKRPIDALPLWIFGILYLLCAIFYFFLWNYCEEMFFSNFTFFLFKIGLIS